jgi:hypothetical protein
MSNTNTPDTAFESDSDTTDTRQRFYVKVPNPKAWFVLGQPDDVGYRGVSMGADDNLFVSVKGQAFHQATSSVQHVTLKYWYQGSYKDTVVNSGANAIVVGKKQVVVFAGAGYAPDIQLELGDSPPTGYFNTLDYHETLDPCRDGVRAYDGTFSSHHDDFRSALGYKVTKVPVPPLTGAKAAILAKLFGAHLPPTENSESIEQFARKHSGLYGKIMQLKKLTDHLERWTSRPDTLPLVGPVIEAGKSLQQSIQGLTSAYTQSASLVQSFLPGGGGSGSKGGFLSDYKQEVGLEQSQAAAARGGGDWTSSANAVAALSGQGLQHMLRPLANRIRSASNVLQSVRSSLDSMGDLLGIKKTASLALVGKDGVSIVSPKKVFAYAADGFHFVSAPQGAPELDFLDKLQMLGDAAKDAVANAVKGLLGLKPTPKLDPVPGFTVRSSGDIVMTSEGRVYAAALGPQGRMQMMSQGVSEFGAVDSAALTARNGTAEVLGKNVVVGSTPKRVKAMAMTATLVAPATAAMDAAEEALQAARKTYLDLVDQRTKLEDEEQLLIDQISAAQRDFDIPKVAQLTTEAIAKVTARIALKAPILAADALIRTANATFLTTCSARQDAEGTSDAVAGSAVAKGMGWIPTEQALADKVEVAAATSIGAYSAGAVKVEAAKKIDLVCESAPPVPMTTTTISMSDKIEISVGDAGLVKMQLTSTGITIRMQNTQITSDGAILTLKAGPSQITLGPSGVVIKGPTIKLDGQMIDNG